MWDPDLWGLSTHHIPGPVVSLGLSVKSHGISEGRHLNRAVLWQTCWVQERADSWSYYKTPTYPSFKTICSAGCFFGFLHCVFCDFFISLLFSFVVCLHIWLATEDSHNNNRFHNIWVTSVRRPASIILASGIFSNSSWSVCMTTHVNSAPPPQSRPTVSSLKTGRCWLVARDRFHVVAMVTAPPNWQDNGGSSQNTWRTTWVCF